MVATHRRASLGEGRDLLGHVISCVCDRRWVATCWTMWSAIVSIEGHKSIALSNTGGRPIVPIEGHMSIAHYSITGSSFCCFSCHFPFLAQAPSLAPSLAFAHYQNPPSEQSCLSMTSSDAWSTDVELGKTWLCGWNRLEPRRYRRTIRRLASFVKRGKHNQTVNIADAEPAMNALYSAQHVGALCAANVHGSAGAGEGIAITDV